MRLLVVGVSAGEICGVRDCAATLAPALAASGAEIETVWWDRDSAAGVRRTLEGAGRFGRELQARAAAGAHDAVLWHYSVFAYGPRGIPLAVPGLARSLAALPAPAIGFVHEYAYPWGRRGWRGTVHAVTQRAALLALVRRVRGLVLTTDDRLEWFRTRPWLPQRPAAVVPVPSNVPPGAAEAPPRSGDPRIGIFGFAREGQVVREVVTALALLRRRGVQARLDLIGSPGPDSAQAARWRAEAERAGCAEAVSFTGLLPQEQLSEALASVEAVVFADETGPSSRRGTLAAALAHGKAVVALDGPQRWQESIDAGAIVVVPRDPGELATSLERLLGDVTARRGLEERARAFYERVCSPAVAAQRLLDLIRPLVEARR